MRPRPLPSLLLAVLAVVLGLAGLAAPSAAGGSWFHSARDRYSPGEEVTFVGYTGGGAYGWVGDGPFSAFLRVEEPTDPGPEGTYARPGELASDVPLGHLVIQETGRDGWLSVRAAVTFTVPDLPPGSYDLIYCSADCSTGLGDLIGGILWVDVDPPEPLTRYWPHDEPARSGASADVPLPPAPPPTTTTPAPSTEPAPTTEPPPAMSAPAGSSVEGSDPSTTGADGDDGPPDTVTAVARPAGDGSPADPAWVLLALGAGVIALTVASGLLLHRRRTAPTDRGPALSPEPGATPDPEP